MVRECPYCSESRHWVASCDLVVVFRYIYTGDDCAEDSELFACEHHTLSDFSCGMSSNPWIMESAVQVMHPLCTERDSYREVPLHKRIMSYDCSFTAISATKLK